MSIDLFCAQHRQLWTGREIGCSRWYEVDQPRIDAFGRATDDVDPMHMDPEWTRRHSPYGTTIAYGFQTLSLLSHLVTDILPRSERESHRLNYGFDRVRMISPVTVGSSIRARVVLKSSRERSPGAVLCHFAVTVEVRGMPKAALIADWLALYVERSAATEAQDGTN